MPYICTCMGLEFLMLMGSCRMYSSITLFFSIYWEKLEVQLISLYRDLTLLFLTTILLHSRDEPSCVHSFPYWCIFALVPSSYYCILEHRTSYIFKDVPYGITRNIFYHEPPLHVALCKHESVSESLVSGNGNPQLSNCLAKKVIITKSPVNSISALA